MPRTAKLTDALRGRGKALVFMGAAAALTGAGAASAATITPAAQPAASHAAALPAHSGPVSLKPESVALLTDALATTEHAPVHHAVAHRAVQRHAVAAHEVAARHEVPARHEVAARRADRGGRRGERRDVPALRGNDGPARPYEIYDSVTPSAIPAGHEVATYADGNFAVTPAQVAGKKVVWIDTNGSDPKAAALDVEPGDATPSGAATWAWQKLHSDPHTQAIIYTMRSEWPAAQAAVASLPKQMQSHVRWWIADPTGVPHVVPGSSATQWYWGSSYDISTARPGF